MGISSIGTGSGLDVEKIITQLVDVEKQPIKKLETKATAIEAKISTYGEIKSLTDTFNTSVSELRLDRIWSTVKINSSNDGTANATMTGAVQPGSYNIEVSQLAQAQTSVTSKWEAEAVAGASGQLNFAVADLNLSVDVDATDTLTSLVNKINNNAALGVHVVASTITDESGQQQLMLRARNTGADGAFTMTVGVSEAAKQGMSEGEIAAVQSQLGRLLPDESAGGQAAQNAKLRLNGVEMTSSSNTLSDSVAGLAITLTGEGKTLLSLTLDAEAVQGAIGKFVESYNALNELLSASTKYTEESKSAGTLQGDSSTVSLQNTLRMITQTNVANATGAYKRLSDIGIQMTQGGKLSLDPSKLAAALKDGESLKSLFAAKDDNMGQGGGVAVRFKAFTDELLSFEGGINGKTDALQKQLKTNATAQEKVEERASKTEARLRTQYSALDSKMASLDSLNSYVSQMVKSWNKSKDD